MTQPDLKNRGVAYWQADDIAGGQPCQKRVYIGTMDAKLHSVDADSGKPCADFGENGVVDVDQWNIVNTEMAAVAVAAADSVQGFSVPRLDRQRTGRKPKSPPGSVFALDARTGALRWTFEMIPEDIAAKTGAANVWASMSVDAEKDMLYIPVSSPSPSFFGGDRLDEIPHGTSITALDIETGKVVWSRQLVHHDLWDYDTNSAPALIDIVKDGVTIPALVQTSKQGFPLCAEPSYRRAGLSDRGAAGAEIGGAGRSVVADAALRRRAAADHRRQMAGRVQARRLDGLRLIARAPQVA